MKLITPMKRSYNKPQSSCITLVTEGLLATSTNTINVDPTDTPTIPDETDWLSRGNGGATGKDDSFWGE